MKFIPFMTALAGAAAIAGSASAQMDYHGFDPETVDALNERLETPLTSEALATLSNHAGIEACGGSKAVTATPPDGWEARLASANPPGGDVVMPVPKTAPSPDYPALYEVLGIEGVCEVMFDVTDEGQTENVLTSCSLPGFAMATEAMVDPLEFDAAEGEASPATENILLPVNYCRPADEDTG